MAVFLRADNGDMLDLPLMSAVVRYPAENTAYSVERDAPVSDHRQRLLVEVDCQGKVTTENGGSAPMEAMRWLRAAEDTTLTVQWERDRDPIESLSIGSWEAVEDPLTDSITVSLPLIQRRTVSVRSLTRNVPRSARVTNPRADQAAGNAEGKDDGKQSGKSIGATALDSAKDLLGLGD